MRCKPIAEGEVDVVYYKTQRDKVACCGCGLTHDIDYKVCGDKLMITVWVNNRSTGQIRRRMKKNKEGVFA